VAKHQRRLPGFDDKVISLYARGLPVREIQGESDRTVRPGGIARPDFHHYGGGHGRDGSACGYGREPAGGIQWPTAVAI
jgi:hypothetical protein